ncbi:hypothetical protein Pfo_013707 [Paulownia fortunei]|nr:hypothetical protein Pfo_013707 [Paulownia fortunei]
MMYYIKRNSQSKDIRIALSSSTHNSLLQSSSSCSIPVEKWLLPRDHWVLLVHDCSLYKKALIFQIYPNVLRKVGLVKSQILPEGDGLFSIVITNKVVAVEKF